MSANDRQVGGDHYRKNGSTTQHWDYAIQKKFDIFQYQITKYVERWKDKNGVGDLEKAKHFLEKYIECYQEFLQSPNSKKFEPGIFTSRLEDSIPCKTGQENPFGYDPKTD